MTVIVLSGPIGAGKSSLTGILSKYLGTNPFYESVDDNPVLPLFYENPKKYAFLLQVYLLNTRFRSIKSALTDDNNVLDRSIYEDALFTRENNAEGNITDTELEVYLKLLDNMMSDLQQLPKRAPDLMVYSETDFETILYRIKKRGRDYEQIDTNPELKDYYYKMWSAYKQWYKDYDASPKMKIDLERYDLEDPKNVDAVLAMIDERLKSLR